MEENLGVNKHEQQREYEKTYEDEGNNVEN